MCIKPLIINCGSEQQAFTRCRDGTGQCIFASGFNRNEGVCTFYTKSLKNAEELMLELRGNLDPDMSMTQGEKVHHITSLLPEQHTMGMIGHPQLGKKPEKTGSQS